jgi:hypothetical protein
MSFSPREYRSTYSLVIDLFYQNPVAARLFLSVTLVSVGLGIVGSYLYSLLISTDQSDPIRYLLLLYLAHKALDWLCELPIYTMQHRAVHTITQYFETKCLEWYSTHVSMEDRERIDANKFHSAVIDIQGSVIKSLSFWLVF